MVMRRPLPTAPPAAAPAAATTAAALLATRLAAAAAAALVAMQLVLGGLGFVRWPDRLHLRAVGRFLLRLQFADGESQFSPRHIDAHDENFRHITHRDAHARSLTAHDSAARVDVPPIVHQVFVADQSV